MTQHAGVEIREVWDFRLSVGSPILFNKGDTWVVQVFANDGGGVLAEHDTGIKTTGNNFDTDAIAACYDWLRTVRDKFSREHLELRKPLVALINATNTEAVKLTADGKYAEVQMHLVKANAKIKKATEAFHAEVAKGGAS